MGFAAAHARHLTVCVNDAATKPGLSRESPEQERYHSLSVFFRRFLHRAAGELDQAAPVQDTPTLGQVVNRRFPQALHPCEVAKKLSFER